MAATERALHNAIRTYARQQRTGQSLHLLRASRPQTPSPDAVSLSTTAHNTATIRQAAVAAVLRRYGPLSPKRQAALVDAFEQKARLAYADRLEGEALPVEAILEWLHSHAEG